MDDNQQNKKLINYVLIGLAIYVLIVLLAYGVNFYHLDISKNDPSEWGGFGDYIGGLLNPVFACLSFIGVLWTLKMSRDELAETKKVMNEQLKTQTLQQFENNFYQLFSQLNKLQDDIKYDENINCILGLKKWNYLTLEGSKEELIRNREISRYFILLYQVMKMIDVEVSKFSNSENSSERENEKQKQKKFYTNLIRSQQDNKMLQLLFINCFDDGFSDFKKYLKEASFFEHMSFQNNADDSYNYLVLSALPYYVVKKEDLQKKKDIPFFDEGRGLLKLVNPKSPYLLRHIYKVQTRSFFDFESSKDIFSDFIYVKPKKMFSEKHILERILFSTPYFIRLEFGNSKMDKNLKVQKIIFNNNEVKWVSENGEELILLLDNDFIVLNKIDEGNNSEYDGFYAFDEMEVR